jgi:hypothetical protein
MWKPAPFAHHVEIELQTRIQGIDAHVRMDGVQLEEMEDATVYLHGKLLEIEKRLAPPPRPRRGRKKREPTPDAPDTA